MRVKGVDTNILVRFLVGDDAIQSKKVYKLFKKAESKSDTLFISLLVIFELIWVLESAYEISRGKIVESISDMFLMPILKFENQSAIQQFTYFSRNNNYDLSDHLIAYIAKEQGCESLLHLTKRPLNVFH